MQHLYGELVNSGAKVTMTHIPYRGGAQIANDLVGGQVDSAVLVLSTAMPFLKDGKIKALSVSDAQRVPQLPSVKAIGEEDGFQGTSLPLWQGLFVKAGTPTAVVATYEKALLETMATPEVPQQAGRFRCHGRAARRARPADVRPAPGSAVPGHREGRPRSQWNELGPARLQGVAKADFAWRHLTQLRPLRWWRAAPVGDTADMKTHVALSLALLLASLHAHHSCGRWRIAGRRPRLPELSPQRSPFARSYAFAAPAVRSPGEEGRRRRRAQAGAGGSCATHDSVHGHVFITDDSALAIPALDGARREVTLRWLPAPLRGTLTGVLLALNTVLVFLGHDPAGAGQAAAPGPRAAQRLRPAASTPWPSRWVANNNAWIAAVHPAAVWDVQGVDGLHPRGWYLVSSNHQSWVDILVLQRVFHGHIPFLKFFLKAELIWVPVIGLAWWALDFPFMKRGKGHGARHSDLQTTRDACEKFKRIPTTVMNFVEGTRFTAAKHAATASPYRHLLKPKVGGLGIALATMGEQFESLLDVTIVYPHGIPTFWQLLCGQLDAVTVRVQVRRHSRPRCWAATPWATRPTASASAPGLTGSGPRRDALIDHPARRRTGALKAGGRCTPSFRAPHRRRFRGGRQRNRRVAAGAAANMARHSGRVGAASGALDAAPCPSKCPFSARS